MWVPVFLSLCGPAHWDVPCEEAWPVRQRPGRDWSWAASATRAARETREGERLVENLRRWLGEAGWSLQRETMREWRSKAGARWGGRLWDALEGVMASWGQQTQPAPTLRAYGNCVMVLSDNERRR